LKNLTKYTITLDDDPTVHKIITKMTGINSLPFTNPEKVIGKHASYNPVAIFVDIHLGRDVSGLDYIRSIREAWPYVPILVITSDSVSSCIGNSLALGANDFVTKPFVKEELCGRLQARICEMHAKADLDECTISNVVFNKIHSQLKCDGKVTYISDLEAKLFKALSDNHGMVLSKDTLKSKIWGDLKVSENALDKKISNLRQSLKEIDASLKVDSLYGQGVVLVNKV